MSMQPGSIDADGLARTTDGKLYVTLGVGSVGATTLLAQSYSPVSCGVDTTEDTLATITVPANLLGANGGLRVQTLWTITSSANNKTLRVRLGGTGGTAYMNQAFGATTGVISMTIIANRNATNSQVGGSLGSTAAGGVAATGAATGSVDTTASTTIVITGQKALNSETLTLEGYTVEVIR